MRNSDGPGAAAAANDGGGLAVERLAEGLSRTARKVLGHARDVYGAHTAEELASLSAVHLGRIPGCGRTSVREIAEALGRLGLVLADEAPPLRHRAA